MLHATAFALVRERRHMVPPPPSEVDAAPIDVIFEDALPTPNADNAPTTQPAVATAASHARGVESAATSEISATESVIAPPLDSSMPLVRPLPDDGQDGRWTFRSTRDVDLKLGDKTASLGRDMASHGQLDLPPPKSAAGVTEALDAIDVSKGFGRAGAVVQAVEAAVRDPAAPPVGVAFFDIAIEKSGKISVSVSERPRIAKSGNV